MMDNIKIEITFEGNLDGFKMTDGEKVLQWNELDYGTQVRVLNSLARFYNMFKKFLKSDG